MKNIFNKLIAAVITALGFGGTVSCDGTDTIPIIWAAYGAPYADFKVNGRITASDDPQKKGIPGIRVRFANDSVEFRYAPDRISALTTENGAYQAEGELLRRDYFVAWIEDIDGDENGRYANRLDTISLSEYKKERINSWGVSTQIDDLDFTLDPAEPEKTE